MKPETTFTKRDLLAFGNFCRDNERDRIIEIIDKKQRLHSKSLESTIFNILAKLKKEINKHG